MLIPSMQPGPNRLNSTAAPDRKRDATLRDICWARRLAQPRAERSHLAERTSATTFEDSAATRENRDATEQIELRSISTATSRRDAAAGFKDGIRSGAISFLAVRYSPTPPLCREQTAQLFASRARTARELDSLVRPSLTHLPSWYPARKPRS